MTTEDKRVSWDAADIMSRDNNEKRLHYLSERDIVLFAAIAASVQWRTRWVNVSGSTQFDDVQAYVASALERLYTPVDFCAEMVNCIETNDAVRNAINALTSTANQNTVAGENTAYGDTSLIAGNADGNGCTDGARYGRIVALVDYINQVMTDFFETIDASISTLQEVENMFSAIPIIETLPVDELINIVGTTGEQWRDSYEASVNTQLLEDFYCDLWCRYPECDISLEKIRLLILERYDIATVFGDVNPLSMLSLISRISTTVASAGGFAYIGDDFVYLSWLMQIVAVELSGEFFGVDIGDYVRQAANGSPSGLWSGCTPCPATWCFDFYGGAGNVSGDAYITDGNGKNNPATYVDNKLVGGEPFQSLVSVAWYIRIDNPAAITAMSGTVQWLAKRARPASEMACILLDDNDNPITQQGASGANVERETSFSFTDLDLSSYDYVTLRAFAAQNTINDGTYCNLTQLTVSGSGATPDIGGTPC